MAVIPGRRPLDSGGTGSHLTALLGPTNTGKTHLAIERMLGHRDGMIDIASADERNERHHLFDANERVMFVRFAEQERASFITTELALRWAGAGVQPQRPLGDDHRAPGRDGAD